MTDTTTTTSTPPPKTEQAKQKATEVASSAGQSAAEVADQAKGQAAEVAVTAVDQVAQVVGTARDELRNRASTEAANFGDRLGQVAEELRAMSQASSANGGVAANLVGGVADQVDKGARRLADGDLESALEDVKRVARNRPGTFLIGAVGMGFLVGRLLRHADLKEIGQAVKPGSSDAGTGNGLSNGHTAELQSSAPAPMARPAPAPAPMAAPAPAPMAAPAPVTDETF